MSAYFPGFLKKSQYMKTLAKEILIGLIAAIGLILLIANSDNMVALVASKIVGAALLIGADKLYGVMHPEEEPL
jgi:ascorbate-specific PTS system EIIC-type component UlaA